MHNGVVMKSLRPLIIVLVLVALIVALFISLASKQKMVTVIEGNLEKQPIPIVLNHFQDSDCGMVIDTIEYASQVVAPDGKTWFFHDHGGMIKWLEQKSFKKDAIIWVYSLDTNRWIDAYKAYYTRNETTPMGYGFGAYEHPKEGRSSFETIRLLTLRGESMINPTIRQQLLKTKKESNGDH